MISPTPHDIAALAETRRRDPDLALALAIEAGRQSDATKPLAIKEKDDERQGARNTNAR
jgi:hypothetical protein